LDLPADVVLARNAARVDRVVPEDVVRRHLAEVRRLVDGDALGREGFASIVVLRDPAAVDAVEIRREGAGPSGTAVGKPHI
jgi:predicted kinase